MMRLLCYVTDRNALAGSVSLNENVARAIAAGMDWIQIREKDLPARELLEVARAAVKVADASAGANATRIIINDRLDVAIAAEVNGVHLGGASMSVATVSAWRRAAIPENSRLKNFLIGASCHSVEAVQAAERDGADYVVFGPVFATPSKEKFGEPQGIKLLSDASKAVRIPVLAIGGISEVNARECFDAGAAGIAAIRMFSEARDLAAVVGRLRD
jgi:thiamine-phosphate pyrophosphorylase